MRIAHREYAHAIKWYETRRRGLGLRFYRAVERVLDTITENPLFYAAVHRDTREAKVPRFPYCVYYRIEPTHIVVFSVFHTSRNPKVWKRRT